MSKLLNLEVANTTNQSLPTLQAANLGNINRKCCCNCMGTPTFSYTQNTTSIQLNQTGYYTIDVNATLSGAVGDAELTLYVNGVAQPMATASETITTANTESRSISFGTIVRVLPYNNATIQVVNTGTTTISINPIDVRIVKIC